jgi:hypothetical protein
MLNGTFAAAWRIRHETASDPDMEAGGSHPTSARTSSTTACNPSGTPLYKPAYINLNDDLHAETERKPTNQREEQSERESSLRTNTSMEAGHTKEGLVAGDGEILKNKSDSAKFQKDATTLKFPNGNHFKIRSRQMLHSSALQRE